MALSASLSPQWGEKCGINVKMQNVPDMLAEECGSYFWLRPWQEGWVQAPKSSELKAHEFTSLQTLYPASRFPPPGKLEEIS